MIVNRIMRGEGAVEDLTTLKEAADGIEFKSFCPFGDAAAWPVQSFLKHFRNEFMDYIEGRKKTLPKYHPVGMIGHKTLPKFTYS